MEQYGALMEALRKHEPIVFLGGAGVSTESGIPDFRSESGIYQTIREYGYPPETILSAPFFYGETETFYDYYKKYLVHEHALPNRAHRALFRLEQAGKLSGIVTQNIDNLHQAAGSVKVLELHGSVYRNHCIECEKSFPLRYIIEHEGVPKCDACGGIIKPDVVLYGEGLDDVVLRGAIARIAGAEMLIVGGTSLAVYPAAGLINYFSGKTLAVINKTPTPADREADIVIHDSIGKVLGDAVDALFGPEPNP
ncbi:MAG: NAD-dependent protein deacylase [Christensenellales bacterium]|jgi:NAD-dependent deacetylase